MTGHWKSADSRAVEREARAADSSPERVQRKAAIRKGKNLFYKLFCNHWKEQLNGTCTLFKFIGTPLVDDFTNF